MSSASTQRAHSLPLRLTLLGGLAVLLLAVTSGGCSDPGETAAEVANACGQQTCPAGTAKHDTRHVVVGSDISGGFNPATYSADGAYKRMGTGDCEYICQVIQACPANSFPIITNTCFTCTAIAKDGLSILESKNCKPQ